MPKKGVSSSNQKSLILPGRAQTQGRFAQQARSHLPQGVRVQEIETFLSLIVTKHKITQMSKDCIFPGISADALTRALEDVEIVSDAIEVESDNDSDDQEVYTVE